MWETVKYWLKHHDYAWKYKLVVCLPIFIVVLISGVIGEVVIQNEMVHGGIVYGDSITIIPHIISFVYQLDPGSHATGGSLTLGGTIGIAAAITFVTGVIIIFLNDKMWLTAFVVIFTGAFLNLLNRAWTPAALISLGDSGDGKGGVLNILHFTFTPFDNWFGYFSCGDADVSVGIVMLVIFVIVEVIEFIVKTTKAKSALDKKGLPAERDPEEYGVRQPRLDSNREEYDEPDLTDDQKRAKQGLEHTRRENMTDRKATSYEQMRTQQVLDDIAYKERRIKLIKAQMKLEKMTKKNEHKSN